MSIVELLVSTGQAPSKSQARRLVQQGAVRINDQPIEDADAEVNPREGDVVQVGRRSIVQISAPVEG